jgi:NAD-dependent deacetylase
VDLNGLDGLASDLRVTDGLVLVVTGAGISLASGIPTFRGTDKDAVWSRDVTELATFHYFCTDPVGSWRWYLARFSALGGAQPNPGHHALVALERWRAENRRPFLLVTQNIDHLHVRAGSSALVEVHGSADRVRCSRDGCALGAPTGTIARDEVDFSRFVVEPSGDHLPRCPACGALLRPHVLWFDEYYTGHQSYQWSRVLAAADEAALVLFIGTSYSVGVTELVLSSAQRRRRPIYSVDPVGRPPDGVVGLKAPAEQILVELLKRLTEN